MDPVTNRPSAPLNLRPTWNAAKIEPVVVLYQGGTGLPGSNRYYVQECSLWSTIRMGRRQLWCRKGK